MPGAENFRAGSDFPRLVRASTDTNGEYGNLGMLPVLTTFLGGESRRMNVSLRWIGATGLMWWVASAAMASPTVDTSLATYPEWNDKTTLPSATASMSFMKDSAVTLASDDEPTAAANQNNASCSCQEGNSCGACDINYCCCPKWYVDAGVVILHRNRSEADPIMRPISIGLPIISGHDDPFGWNGDLDITVGYRVDCCNAWEVRYFGDTGADANAAVDFGGIPESFTIATGGPFSLLGFTVDYRTDLHSLELNQRHTVTDNVTFLSGFRYLEIDEDLKFGLSILGSQVATYAWSDDNHLYGGQIGTDLSLWNNGPLRVNSVFKGGVYGVQADNAYTNQTILGTFVRNGATASDVAFVGEIDLLGTYSICQHVAVRGGYQLLWIDGVALASDAASQTNPVNGGAVIDTNGQLFYHGATVALEFTW